jgi:pilus assembly protein CpaE
MTGAAAGDRIRVLIVDDDGDMRENLKKLMTLESDIEVVGTATGGVEGVQMATELNPDVITMDINMQDMDGLAATSKILAKHKRVAIIMLSVQYDMSYVRRAMQSGACDFLTKPPEMDELINTIRRCYEGLPSQAEAAAPTPVVTQQAPVTEGSVIVAYGPKGGVGTTTVATSLAVGLARRGGQVVLVDTDLQYGDVGIFLNLRLPNSIADLTLAGEAIDPESVSLVTGNHDSGASVLLAPHRTEQADTVSAQGIGNLVGYLKTIHQYVIVDTGTVVDDNLLAVIDVADRVMILSTPDIPSLKNVSLFYDVLDLLNFPEEQTWFVLNRLVKGSAITADRVAERLNRAVAGQIMDDSTYPLRAVNAGEPLINQDAGKSVSVRGLVDLVKFVEQDIVAELQERAAHGADGGPMSRLF